MSDGRADQLLTPAPDKRALRRRLVAERMAMPDRAEQEGRLARVLAAWLTEQSVATIGAYWPIKGEFDALPTLVAWARADLSRRIGLPLIDPETQCLRFHGWYPGCVMDNDAFGIPMPNGTEVLETQLLLVPCVGFGPGGLRLGYGGGFYDRTLAAVSRRPRTAGIVFAQAWVPSLAGEPHDVPLDAILTEDGVAWRRP
jgi:5-formyltetrahydrofolate cyclo-ligase